MTSDTIGGVWNYALRLIGGLAFHDIDVTLVTMGRMLTDGQWREVACLKNVDVMESAYRLEWMQAPWQDVDAAGRWLLEIEESVRPDIIHLNQFAHGSLPWHAPTVTVGHSCVCSWTQAVQGEAPAEQWNEYRRRVTEGLKAAGAVVAPTLAMLEQLHHWYGVAFGDVIPHSRPDRPLCESAPEIRQPYLLSADRLWDEAKNIQLLRTIAHQVGSPIRVVGAIPHSDSGGLADCHSLELLGSLSQDELYKQMHSALLYVHPAKYEPFGIAPLQAASCGCPLVLADIPSLRQVWGNAAVYLDPHSPSDWANCLNRLIDDRQERERLGMKAFKRSRLYSVDRMADRYVDLYRRLVTTCDVSLSKVEHTR